MIRILLPLLMCLVSGTALARDTTLHLPLDTVLSQALEDGVLDGSVRFYLEGQPMPAVLDTYGQALTNRKTNALNKSDAEACRWVMLSALIALQQQAKSVGANAVIGLVSYYKKREYVDADKVECHAGALMAGVALRGSYARVADR